MAATLKFKLKGKEYEAVPVKLERKKLYGYTDIVATDAAGKCWFERIATETTTEKR